MTIMEKSDREIIFGEADARLTDATPPAECAAVTETGNDPWIQSPD